MNVKQCGPSALSTLQAWLRQKDIPKKKALIGFDGYVDTLYRVVKGWLPDGQAEYYRTISEYGTRILAAAGKSADIQIQQLSRRLGGNAPLMSAGLAHLGDNVTLIGELGYPKLDACFAELASAVHAYSIGEPCQTIAFEFDDGKIMLGDMLGSESLSWQGIQHVLGESAIKREIEEADFIAVLNCSAHRGMPDVAREVARIASRHTDTRMFFDLSDPNALSAQQLRGCLQTIADIGQNVPTVLGMNENEACTVMRTLFPEIGKCTDSRENIRQYGASMLERLSLKTLTVHATAWAMAWSTDEAWYADGFYVEKPLLSTGAGDHYNAAFCHGLAHGRPLPECLLLGCGASAHYVQYGKSPTRLALANERRNA